MPMQAGHILLGSPCQYNQASIHDHRTNFYLFTHHDRKYTLAPLSPTKVNELHSKMNQEDKVSKPSLYIIAGGLNQVMSVNGTM